MMGVAALDPGMGALQRAVSFDQVDGRFFSLEEPLN